MCFTIKPLEWEYHERPMMTYVVRDERGLCYHINQYFGSDSYYFATVRHDGKILYDGDDLPSAQAAAQADYEARILSALAPQAGDNAEEPAGYLFEMRYESERWSGNMFSERINIPASDVRNVRPLYSHPCTSTPVVSQNAPDLEDKGGDVP